MTGILEASVSFLSLSSVTLVHNNNKRLAYLFFYTSFPPSSHSHRAIDRFMGSLTPRARGRWALVIPPKAADPALGTRRVHPGYQRLAITLPRELEQEGYDLRLTLD